MTSIKVFLVFGILLNLITWSSGAFAKDQSLNRGNNPNAINIPACFSAEENSPQMVIDAICQKSEACVPGSKAACLAELVAAEKSPKLSFWHHLGLKWTQGITAPLLSSFVNKGTVEVHHDHLCGCLKEISELSCDEVSSVTSHEYIIPKDAVCGGVFHGKGCKFANFTCTCSNPALEFEGNQAPIFKLPQGNYGPLCGYVISVDNPLWNITMCYFASEANGNGYLGTGQKCKVSNFVCTEECSDPENDLGGDWSWGTPRLMSVPVLEKD